ncbi:hypothetical protein JAAARDRAFT_99512, partial [Jaapia argillacea MUCL 33604]
CRVGHAFIGEYYVQFNIPEPVDCPCGIGYQTREHILRDCPRYEDHRYHLRDVSPQISLPTILGTRKGVDALASFIWESGAFMKTGEPRPKHWELPEYENEPDPEPWDEDAEDD